MKLITLLTAAISCTLMNCAQVYMPASFSQGPLPSFHNRTEPDSIDVTAFGGISGGTGGTWNDNRGMSDIFSDISNSEVETKNEESNKLISSHFGLFGGGRWFSFQTEGVFTIGKYSNAISQSLWYHNAKFSIRGGFNLPIYIFDFGIHIGKGLYLEGGDYAEFRESHDDGISSIMLLDNIGTYTFAGSNFSVHINKNWMLKTELQLTLATDEETSRYVSDPSDPEQSIQEKTRTEFMLTTTIHAMITYKLHSLYFTTMNVYSRSKNSYTLGYTYTVPITF